MRWIFLLLALGIPQIDAWICGNDGQCRCTSSGEVICAEIKTAPYFIEDYRPGKRLTIKTSPDFGIESLDDMIGFDRVLIMGLTKEQCRLVEREFPDVGCLKKSPSYDPAPSTIGGYFTAPNSGTWLHKTTDSKTQKDGNDEHKQRAAVASAQLLNGMLAWTVASGFIGAVMTACILVSLVNLHARINTHARCNDPPMFAVSCCLKCMAVCLCHFHFCAKFSKCTSCCLHTLEQGVRGTSTTF